MTAVKKLTKSLKRHKGSITESGTTEAPQELLEQWQQSACNLDELTSLRERLARNKRPMGERVAVWDTQKRRKLAVSVQCIACVHDAGSEALVCTRAWQRRSRGT